VEGHGTDHEYPGMTVLTKAEKDPRGNGRTTPYGNVGMWGGVGSAQDGRSKLPYGTRSCGSKREEQAGVPIERGREGEDSKSWKNLEWIPPF